jgi:Ni/Co efflux regulator RcnB
MKTRISILGITRLAMVPLLSMAVGVAAAQGNDRDRNDRHDDHHDNGNRGNQQGRGNSDHEDRGDHGNDFRFRDQDRGNFQSHYNRDVDRWRRRPQGRPQFVRGQQIPPNYRFQPVPRAYYSNVPPPPMGYQYGYYDGYVVAYNPTTRIIADVLDLVTAATR